MMIREEDLLHLVNRLNFEEKENWSYELTEEHKIAIYDETKDLVGFYVM